MFLNHKRGKPHGGEFVLHPQRLFLKVLRGARPQDDEDVEFLAILKSVDVKLGYAVA